MEREREREREREIDRVLAREIERERVPHPQFKHTTHTHTDTTQHTITHTADVITNTKMQGFFAPLFFCRRGSAYALLQFRVLNCVLCRMAEEDANVDGQNANLSQAEVHSSPSLS